MKCGLLLAAVILLGASAIQSAAEPVPGDRWRPAQEAITRFLAPRVEAARSRHNDASIQAAEYRSALLMSQLPDYRFHVLTGPYDSSSKIFAVSADAKIVDLGDGTWSGNEQGFRLKLIPEFLRAQKILVRTEEEAIRFAQLLEEVQGSASYVGFLQINTAGFKVFDSRFIARHYGPQTDWKFSASPQDGGWLVRREYVGPPAMVPEPPSYRIKVDSRKQFADVVDVGRLPAPAAAGLPPDPNGGK